MWYKKKKKKKVSSTGIRNPLTFITYPFSIKKQLNSPNVCRNRNTANSSQRLLESKAAWREKGQEMLTLLHTPIKLSQNVIKQDVTEGLKVLGEDIADGIKCMVAGGGHPLCFLRAQHNLCEIFYFVYQHENKDYDTFRWC